MANIVSTKTFVAGAPSGNSGPSHPPSVYDHLLVSGGTIGTTDTQTLRRIFHKMGIEGAHHLGRERLSEIYNAMVNKVRKDAGDAAVKTWLEAYED